MQKRVLTSESHIDLKSPGSVFAKVVPGPQTLKVQVTTLRKLESEPSAEVMVWEAAGTSEAEGKREAALLLD